MFKRRRALVLGLPIGEWVEIERIPLLNVELSKFYGGISERTVFRDLKEVEGMQLVIRVGREIRANVSQLTLTGHLPRHRVF